MLIREMEVMAPKMNGDIYAIIAMLNGRASGAQEIREGVYEIGHFGGTSFLRGYEHYPSNLSVHCYGVCDSVDQLLEKCPELVESDRKFVVTVHTLKKSDQPLEGGWRWHKWGDYIGTQDPQCEYLHDEPVIEQVMTYHIYEKV